jgi:hypothetical protein
MMLNGLRIVPHPLAERVYTKARIERTAVKKRRRGWTLRYETVREPCAIQAGGVIYMHPSAYAQMAARAQQGDKP